MESSGVVSLCDRLSSPTECESEGTSPTTRVTTGERALKEEVTE